MRIVASAEGYSRECWQEFAELGFLAALFAEEYGGLGSGTVETMIIMEEYGRRLVVEPFVETVVLAGGLLRDLGSEDQRQAFLPRIIDGSDLWFLAWAEAQGRHDLHDISLRAERGGNGYRLNGSKRVVVGAPWADRLIVSARTAGGQRDRRGISLFIVDKSQSGIDCRGYATSSTTSPSAQRCSSVPKARVSRDSSALWTTPLQHSAPRRSAAQLHDPQLCPAAQAVRCAARQVSGYAALDGRHVHCL